MKYVIFYSWQSDLPNNTNRGFIESVIEKAIKNTNSADRYDLEPTIDRDTKDVPGSPNITQTLIEKIRTCDAFVADISIVTGRLNADERPSPNPNVLLELGYAIAILGWEKIVLFYNEAYGSDEDLPFDIRQHRRIPYRLEKDELKSPVRSQLVELFRSRLLELLKGGKSSSGIKKPVLKVFWNYVNDVNDAASDSETNSHELILHRAIDDLESVKAILGKELAQVNEIDGRIDPKWTDKKEKFVQNANDFLKKISEEPKTKNYLIERNRGKLCPVTLSVGNDGNQSASEIRVEIELPEWVFGVKSFPDKRDVPIKPEMPVPYSKIQYDILKLENELDLDLIQGIDFGRVNRLLSLKEKSTSDCYVKNNCIKFWADRLLHKHVITNKDNRFYLLALPNAPVGEHKIKGKIFCIEQDDWQEFELFINVIKPKEPSEIMKKFFQKS